MVARWKPVHLGHAAVLRGLVRHSEHALIGIGSANKYDRDNPFTAHETQEMIERVLVGHRNFSILHVPDLGHGPRWRAMVREMMGPVDLFVTANAYVHSLMREVYPILHPVHLIAAHERTRLSGTMARQAMAQPDESWRELVPACIAEYLTEKQLVDRFRREFVPAQPPRA